MADNAEQKQELTLSLTVDEINVVFAGLDEMPHKYSAPVVEKIKNQAVPQIPQGEAEVVESEE